MSRNSLRNGLFSNKQSLCSHQSRITESTNFKSKFSYQNSNFSSSSNSMANISINFLKDSCYPKLFTNSPSVSLNEPQTTKSGSLRNSVGFKTNMSRTPSGSSLTSFNQFFSKDHFRKKSLFTKKCNQLPIDFVKQNIPKCKNQYQPGLPIKQNKQNSINCNFGSYNSQSLGYESISSISKQENIKVFIRIKPNEIKDLCIKPYITRIDQKNIQFDGKIVGYDHVFPIESKQQQIFDFVCQPILNSVFDGYNGTIFAYGQTGSGKTYTMFGQGEKQKLGIIYRAIRYIFEKKKQQMKISISLLQIYKQELIDLTTDFRNQLKIKETQSGVVIEGLLRNYFQKWQQALSLVQSSFKNRRVASTKINQKSSRSHTILTIHIQSVYQQSKLCLIDLAGSEKANKAGVSGQNFQQMKKINYSLSCLGNVINALVTRKKSDHIPYRDSKLTRLLKDSLSGKSKTSIVVNCSSDLGTEQQTSSSLKFADRAKKIKVSIGKCQKRGKENVEYYQNVIKQLTVDLQNTKKQLSKYKQIIDVQSLTHPIEKKEKKEFDKKISQQAIQLTTRQTIPSQRANLDNQIKKYKKQRKVNVVSICHSKKKKIGFNFNSQLSSLNVSKSTINFFGQIGTPSVSSLSYRPDDYVDDLSFNFSTCKQNALQGNGKN